MGRSHALASSSFESTERLRAGQFLWDTHALGDETFEALLKSDVAFAQDEYQIALVRRKSKQSWDAQPLTQFDSQEGFLLLPLTWKELLERIRCQVAGQASFDREGIAWFGEVQVNFSTMQVHKGKRPIPLKRKEFKLLKFFVQHPKAILSRSELLNEVWGYNNYPTTRTVDHHVCMLRRKLELEPGEPRHFLTVHGTGYTFAP